MYHHPFRNKIGIKKQCFHIDLKETNQSQSCFCAITDFILNNSAAQGLKTCVIGVDGRSLMVFGVYVVVVDTNSPSTMSSTMVFTMTVLVELTPPPPILKL